MTNSSEITFKVATTSDFDKILELLLKHFYPDEPLSSGWYDTPNECIGEDGLSMKSLKDSTTIIAVTNDGEIVGACVADPSYPDEAEKLREEAARLKSEKWSAVLNVLVILEEKANLYKRFNITKSIHMNNLVVNPKVRGQSIGIKLMGKCMENARQLGYEIACTDCTSKFSIRIAEQLGMECIETFVYDEYRHATDGRLVFKVKPPHMLIKTFIQRLNDYNFDFIK